ncbi:MAG: sodium:solute symporter family protein [Spirochaetes bacterium]|nr:sodium:solute symporter family protein [Spirochaetota bacterium]
MSIRLGIVLTYLLALLAISIVFRRVSSKDRVEFYLAGRKVPGVLLFFTMAATNFSAFTVFGLSGAGYRIGYAFFPVMGFGTGFMALSFLVIGMRINVLARARGYVTPADFIADRYGSRTLKSVFSLVMIVFTLPYLATQAIASGRALETLAGLPYWAGAGLVTGVSVLVVALGGMRSDAWTDVVQGLMMILFTAAAFALIAAANGGFVAANARAFAAEPTLFSRPGADGSLAPGVWLGYLLLWLCADPMFPQLFQRFMAASDRRSLATTAALYPVVTTVLFFLTVSIGVMGRASLPGLTDAQPDNVFTLLLERHVGGPLAALLLTAGMAALMSTLDSQLLSLGSMITLDFSRRRRPGVLAEKLVLVAVGAAGYLIALRPPKTLLDLLTSVSFTGFAVLAPVVVGGLYWRRASARAAIAGIVAGEALVVAFALRLLRLPGVLPVVPVLAVTVLVFVVGSLLDPEGGGDPGIAARAPKGTGRWTALFAVFFVLGCDFWAWGRRPVLVLGLPLWVLYYGALGLLLAVAIWACARWALKDRAETSRHR